MYVNSLSHPIRQITYISSAQVIQRHLRMAKKNYRMGYHLITFPGATFSKIGLPINP